MAKLGYERGNVVLCEDDKIVIAAFCSNAMTSAIFLFPEHKVTLLRGSETTPDLCEPVRTNLAKRLTTVTHCIDDKTHSVVRF